MDEALRSMCHSLKDEHQFPSLSSLQQINHQLSILESKATESIDGIKLMENCWPVDLRIVIRRLLQTSAIIYNAPSTSKDLCFDEFLPLLFELSDKLAAIIGKKWFQSDPDFLLLLAFMTSMRLQEVFRCEASDNEALVLGRLLCQFVRCGEDADILSDDKATILSKSLQQSALNLCEYYEINGKNSDHVKKVIVGTFQFMCTYINLGGLQTLPPKYARNLGKDLVRHAVNCCDYSLIPLECLANIICELQFLPNSTMGEITNALKLCNTKANEKGIIRILEILIMQLNGKVNASGEWCTASSLREAYEFLRQMKSGRVIKMKEADIS